MMPDGMKRPCVRCRVQSPASMLGVPLPPCEIMCFFLNVETCPLIRQALQNETKIQVPPDFPIASAIGFFLCVCPKCIWVCFFVCVCVPLKYSFGII